MSHEPAAARADVDELERLRNLVDQLQTALESRLVIEQAKDVLAERFDLDQAAAFALLRYSALAARLRMHDLAAQVVAGKATPPALLIGVARAQRWQAAAHRERAEAQRQRAEQVRRGPASAPDGYAHTSPRARYR